MAVCILISIKSASSSVPGMEPARRGGTCSSRSSSSTKSTRVVVAVAVLLQLCCLATVSRSQPSPATVDFQVGWIVSGPGHAPDGLPSCSFCINVINAVFYRNWTDLRVGMYRCLKQDQNELWAVDAQRHTISLVDPANQRLCLDTGATGYATAGSPPPLLPMRLRPCDGTPSQRWFFDDPATAAGGGTLRSNLTDSAGRALVLAQGVADAGLFPGVANDTDMSAYFNLYLAANDASMAAATPGFLTAAFTFQPLSNYVGRRYPGLGLQSPGDGDQAAAAASTPTNVNLLRNGGFERTTVLTRWPAAQNCSSFTRSCSRVILFSQELFALCSWAVVSPPEVVRDRAPRWTAAAGAASLLLSYRASVNQTFATRAGVQYRVSFAMAGVLAHDAATDGFHVCAGAELGNANGTNTFVTVQVDAALPALFSLAPAELTPVAGDTVWVAKNLTFRATADATTLTIASVGTGACGPVIDNVRVVLVTDDGGGGGSGGSSHGGGHGAVAAAAAAAGGAGFLLLLLLLGVCAVRRRRQKQQQQHQQNQQQRDVKVFSYSKLEKATSNWSTVLGEGGFSTVYRGEFPDGTLGAVKVEKRRRSSSSLFQKELDLLRRVSHAHLVNLIGFCADKDHPILVFEYLPNGSLYDRLHSSPSAAAAGTNNPPPDPPAPLTWRARMRIAHQLAHALHHLHHATSPPIGHRDVKSANVLLDASDRAKLADLGLSKAAHPADASRFHTVHTGVKGSVGYLDPRYAASGVYSLKSDVYSYGVVLLELVTGQRAVLRDIINVNNNIDSSSKKSDQEDHGGTTTTDDAASSTTPKQHDLLALWAAKYIHDPGIAQHMVDARLHQCGGFDHADLRVLLDLIKMCLLDDAHRRPSMNQVLAFLADSHFSGCRDTDD